MALSFMRRHRRWLYVFLWLVIAAFIILYIPAFQDASQAGGGAALGSVGDRKITLAEFQAAYRDRLEFYRSLYQGRLDGAALQQLGIEEQVFDGLVEQRLVELEAERLGLTVDDQALQKAIVDDPQFQRDGRFIGGDELRRLIEAQGLRLQDVERSLRASLMRQRLQSAVTAAVAVSDDEARREYRRRSETVRVEYVAVDAAPLREGVAPTDAEVQQRFESAKESYRVPEQRVVSYLYLDFEALRARESATQAEIEAEYNANRERFRQEPQACARHVLVKVRGEQGEGHPEAEARRRAQVALDRIRGGADFAEVAKAVSEDKGSAPGGGDLGCFPRGAMVPEFDAAAFALEPGQVSDLVRSSYGFHVIQLVSRREEGVQPLLAVADAVKQGLLARKAQERMVAQAEQIAADLRRGRSLEEAGRPAGLTVQKSAAFARGEAPPPISSPLLSARAFALAKGAVHPEPLGLARGAAFIRVDEIQPSRLPELGEVRDRVRSDLVARRALELAAERAAALRARAAAEGLAKAAVALGLTRKETPAPLAPGQPLPDAGNSDALEQALLDLAPEALSEPVRTGSGYVVLRLLERKVAEGQSFDAQKGAIRAALIRARREQLFEAFLRQARERHPITRDTEAYRRLVG
jgi:peptidyl-prolyl cis-trans isomerase D